MTLDEVEFRMESIWLKGEADAETAHEWEDALYRDVLGAIASGSVPCSSAREMAARVLETQDYWFPRWYA